MEAQYLKNNHVTYYVITQGGVYAAQQWYVITSDVTWDSHPPTGRANKVLGAGVQTSCVHSSIISNMCIHLSASHVARLCNLITVTRCRKIKVPENGHLSGDYSTEYGSTVEVHCDRGYRCVTVAKTRQVCLSIEYNRIE